ncbi:hypothetical protein LIER_20988 [Lithospermum erythrorhizon]|uniref:MADS-box domain-containing protein n=1 Tax=Lithospermum erythrorhizon TaxID=34254 RepID=A0AAV3QR03_LITER
MGRGKSVVPSLIQDKRKRIQTFQKRKKCLEKKAYELSTLCEVNVAMIMFALDDEVVECTNDPIIWPKDPNVARKMITLYQNKYEIDKNRIRNTDIASVYEERARLVGNEVDKMKKLMIVDEYPIWDELYDSFSNDKLLMLGNELDNVLVVLQSRIDSTMKAHQMFQAGTSNNQLHGLNSFNCLDSEGALVLHNYQTMKTMDASSSCSNMNNYNNIVPVNFDHVIENTNYHLPPFPGFGDNFVQNNNNLILDHLQNPYLCYAPLQDQKPIFMPFSLSSIPTDAYSHMVQGEIGNAKIHQFRGNFFFG